MTAFEREIGRVCNRLLRADQRAHADVLRAYGSVHRRLFANLRALTLRTEQAEAAGVEVRPGWLFAHERYRHLLADLEQGTIDFAGRAAHWTRQGQVAVAALARDDVPGLAAHAAGPAPHPAARRQLPDTFARAPHTGGYSAATVARTLAQAAARPHRDQVGGSWPALAATRDCTSQLRAVHGNA